MIKRTLLTSLFRNLNDKNITKKVYRNLNDKKNITKNVVQKPK